MIGAHTALPKFLRMSAVFMSARESISSAETGRTNTPNAAKVVPISIALMTRTIATTHQP